MKAVVPTRMQRAGVKWINDIDWDTPSVTGTGVGTYEYQVERGDLPTFGPILKMLSEQGIMDIYLKVSDVQTFYTDGPPGDPRDIAAPDKTVIRAARDAELLDFILKVYDSFYPFNIYLYKRNWFNNLNDAKAFPKNMVEDRAPEFIDEMAAIINAAKAINGADGGSIETIIEGVMPIETQLNDFNEVLYTTKYLMDQLNAATTNWLVNRTFLMPGAGNGWYFKGCSTANLSSTFWDDIGSKVNRFGFVVKVMPATDATVCKLANINLDGWAGGLTTRQYARFLNNTMGLSELYDWMHLPDANGSVPYVSHPKLANTLFWGDSGDGIEVIQNYPRRPEAVRKVLVRKVPRAGYAFDFAVDTRDRSDGFQNKVLLVTHAGDAKPALNTGFGFGDGDVFGDFINWYDLNVVYK